MFEEGLIPKDFASISIADYVHNIDAGKVGMWSASANLLCGYRSKFRTSNPDEKIDMIPSPRGPENSGGHLLYSSVISSYYINSKVPRKKRLRSLSFLIG
jgi:putative aldouronate transport system substrate-binding protein